MLQPLVFILTSILWVNGILVADRFRDLFHEFSLGQSNLHDLHGCFIEETCTSFWIQKVCIELFYVWLTFLFCLQWYTDEHSFIHFISVIFNYCCLCSYFLGKWPSCHIFLVNLYLKNNAIKCFRSWFKIHSSASCTCSSWNCKIVLVLLNT